MLDFLLGAAIIVLPVQHQVPLALGAAALRAVRAAGRRRRAKKQAANGAPQSRHVTLEWSRLSCTLASDGGAERALLHEVHGRASSGRLLAICGPSGSGKTTLLNILAGQLPYSRRVTLRGCVTANGQPVPAPGIRAGFVAQEDLFFSQMTVRETLDMAAEMRMPAGTAAALRSAAVEAVIRRLGLSKCAGTVVGDAKTRGLSGGEKKRLSIACELIAAPQLILADEPTSGLDAFAALQAMQALKDLAADGHTVITCIHQPRSSIFEMFDDLCLLAEGQLVYQGPAAEAVAHFAALGFACPDHYNPAEFLADLVAVDHSSAESEAASHARVRALVAAWGRAHPPEAHSTAAAAAAKADGAVAERAPGCGPWRQAALLLRRSWRQVTRDKATAASRASGQIASAAVFSAIYWRMGRGQASIQDRLGLLQVSAVGTAMSSLIKTLNVFPRERTIVQRERARAPYPVLPYLAAKLAAELPVGALFPALFGAIVYPATGLNPRPLRFARFLGVLAAESFAAQGLGLAVGAAAPSTEAALAIGPAVILVSIVFGGLFVNDASVPRLLKWVPRTSLIKHAFEAACVNEFSGQEFEPGEGGRGEASGEAVLARLAFKSDGIGGSVANQARIVVFYWWATFCILEGRQAKFQPVEPPLSLEVGGGFGDGEAGETTPERA